MEPTAAKAMSQTILARRSKTSFLETGLSCRSVPIVLPSAELNTQTITKRVWLSPVLVILTEPYYVTEVKIEPSTNKISACFTVKRPAITEERCLYLFGEGVTTGVDRCR